MSENKFTISGPVEQVTAEIIAPKKVAAGFPALTNSLKHARREMNFTSCTKALFSLNQFNGVDCPGCAWPDPDEDRSSLGEYCENGVKAIAEEATTERITRSFFEKHTITELSNWSDYELGKSGRLTEPMILRKDAANYEPLSWQEAFEYIGQKLKSLSDPNEAIFYTSGRTSNEAAFLYQLFVRLYGTSNMPDCSNMCHESSGVGLSNTLGIGKGSVMLEDFYISDLIIVMGQNPGTNHPRMLSALQKAKKAGAKIVSINPLPEAGLTAFKHPQKVGDLLGKATKIGDLHLPVKVNGDVALLKAVMLRLKEEDDQNLGSIFDHKFIDQNTEGIESFLEDLSTYDLKNLLKQSGITLSEVDRLVDLIKHSKKIICCWAMGLTQHKNGVDNIQEVVNLLLLKGSVGIPGGGTCPVRGHSNVQGDRTMGVWEKAKPGFLKKLNENFGVDPNLRDGYDTVGSIAAMAESKVKVFFAMGGNFLSATPDTEITGKALQNCDLTVQVSTKLNRSHVVTGTEAIILPCLGRTEIDEQKSGEQYVTVENSMGIVHSSSGVLKPASNHLKSEVAIVCELAKKTLKNSSVRWDDYKNDYSLIRDAVENTIPGFEDYNKRSKQDAGFYLPNCARDGKFETSTGKAKFTINKVSAIKMAKDELLMMTIRSHDQFNTTIYGMNDRYRGILNGRRVVMMNEQDIKQRGLKQGDLVDLTSTYDGKTRHAKAFMVVSYPIPESSVATYFPEANVLIPFDKFADKSKTPISKSVVVKVVKSR